MELMYYAMHFCLNAQSPDSSSLMDERKLALPASSPPAWGDERFDLLIGKGNGQQLPFPCRQQKHWNRPF